MGGGSFEAGLVFLFPLRLRCLLRHEYSEPSRDCVFRLGAIELSTSSFHWFRSRLNFLTNDTIHISVDEHDMPQTRKETPNYVYTVASEQVKNDRARMREGSTCPRA